MAFSTWNAIVASSTDGSSSATRARVWGPGSASLGMVISNFPEVPASGGAPGTVLPSRITRSARFSLHVPTDPHDVDPDTASPGRPSVGATAKRMRATSPGLHPAAKPTGAALAADVSWPAVDVVVGCPAVVVVGEGVATPAAVVTGDGETVVVGVAASPTLMSAAATVTGAELTGGVVTGVGRTVKVMLRSTRPIPGLPPTA